MGEVCIHQSQPTSQAPRQGSDEVDSEPTNVRGGTALGQMQNREAETHRHLATPPTSPSPCPEHRLNSARRKTPAGKPCFLEMSCWGQAEPGEGGGRSWGSGTGRDSQHRPGWSPQEAPRPRRKRVESLQLLWEAPVHVSFRSPGQA